MHVPKMFAVTDRKLIARFVQETGLATLVTAGDGAPIATHVPLQWEVNAAGQEVLRGHLSKANPQWHHFENHPQVLAIFLSPVHHYISSSWYNHPNAPTWNYLSVHISGPIAIIEGEALWESVRRLTNHYEQHVENPVSLDTLPHSVQRQMEGIVGFEIRIEQVEAAFKLSQNRNEEDFPNILHQLRRSGNALSVLMAEVMEQHRAEG